MSIEMGYMSVPLYWRLKKQRYSLVGTKCGGCGELHFPPRSVCLCGSETLHPFQFAGKGTIVSYTIIRTAPSGFEGNVPYCVGLIKLDEGPVISAELVDFNNAAIDKRVGLVFRKQGENKNDVINYNFKFSIVD